MRPLLLTLLVFLGACTAIPAPSPIQSDGPRPATNAARDAALAAWGRLLAAHVDDRGRVDFLGVAADPEDLEQMVAFVWQFTPRSHPELWPDPRAALAYWIDAYNALAMYTVIRDGIPDDVASVPKRIDFFILNRLTVGGEDMSLRQLENQVIRPLGEPRIHWALNCMAVSCPILPKRPFSGPNFDRMLAAETDRFFREARNYTLDAGRKTAVLTELLDFFEEDFEAAGGIRAYVNSVAPRPIPADYEIAFRPYNWTINAQP